MAFTELTQDAFIAHINTVKEKSFLQSPEMASLLKKRGFQVTYVGYQEEGKTKVSALLYSKPMAGGLYMEINSGPVTNSIETLPAFYRELASYAKAKGAMELVIKPYLTYQTFDSQGNPTSDDDKHLITTLTNLGYRHDGLHIGYPGGEPDWHYVKDLSGLTVDTLTASFSKKAKPLLKKTHSFGIQLRALKREELTIFKEITAATSERREYTDKPLDYYEDFYDAFSDSCEFMLTEINFKDYSDNLVQSKALIEEKITSIEQHLKQAPKSAKHQNMLKELRSQVETFEVRLAEASVLTEQYGQKTVPLAASLFVYTPQEAVYLFSGSYTEFNKFYAPVLLQEHAMLQALKRGIQRYNFLGIQGIFDGSDGVLRFKQQFNGSIERKAGTFRYYPNPIKYRLINLIKRLLRR